LSIHVDNVTDNGGDGNPRQLPSAGESICALDAPESGAKLAHW